MRVSLMMDDMDELHLTPELEAEATDRDDDLGRIFAAAFTISVPTFPFRQGCPQKGGA